MRSAIPLTLLLAGAVVGGSGAAAQDAGEAGPATPAAVEVEVDGVVWALDPSEPVQVCVTAATATLGVGTVEALVFLQTGAGFDVLHRPPAPATGALAEADAGSCFALDPEAING